MGETNGQHSKDSRDSGVSVPASEPEAIVVSSSSPAPSSKTNPASGSQRITPLTPSSSQPLRSSASGTARMNKTQIMTQDGRGNLLPGQPLGERNGRLTLPGYQFLTELGSGGMGTVFLARQESLSRYVAIKMIRGEIRQSSANAMKLQDEALKMAMLSHPNVLGCNDIITTRDGVFLVMEYIPGRMTARSLVARYGPLKEHILVRVLRDVVSGLSYIYQKGLLHRDLKPDNLMIFREEQSHARSAEELFQEAGTRVVICDFGISHAVDTLTDSSQVVGSPMYMAPEQFSATELQDCRADIYAMAGVAYFLLTGKPPFRQKTRDELLEYKLEHSIPSPQEENVHISPELTHVLMRMGHVDPTHRYQDYRELLDDLERLSTMESKWFVTMAYTFRRRVQLRRVLLGVVLASGLWGSWFFYHYFWKPYVQERRTSLTEQLMFWRRPDTDTWRVIQDDTEESCPYLRGRSGAVPVILLMPFVDGMRLEFQMRAFGEGTVLFGFMDNGGKSAMQVEWSHLEPKKTVFHLQSESNARMFIGDHEEQTVGEWVQIRLQLSEQRIIISANGKMMGVAHHKVPRSGYQFYIQAKRCPVVELKNMYRIIE